MYVCGGGGGGEGRGGGQKQKYVICCSGYVYITLVSTGI